MAAPLQTRLFYGLPRAAVIRPGVTAVTAKTAAAAATISLARSNARLVPARRQPEQYRCFTATRQAFANQKEDLNASQEGPPIPDVTNYYTLFPSTFPNGPPPNSPFEIPLRPLRGEFLALQGQSHPDKYPPGIPKQRAEAISALLNEAYRTLVDPLFRAQYLLRVQHGVDVTAEDSAAADKQMLDKELLIAVMEVQERIEEIAEEVEDVAEAEKVIAEMKKENTKRVQMNVQALGDCVDRGDVEGMRRECVRLRFWYSVGEGLREWEPGVREIRLVH